MQPPYRPRLARVRLIPVFAIALGIAACSADSTLPSYVSGTPTGAPVTGLSATLVISPSSATDSVGRTTQFTATVYDGKGSVISTRRPHWRSSDTTIVSVDSNGKAKRVGVGRTKLTASVDSLSADAQTTSLGDAIVSISVTPDAATLSVGQSVQYTATLRDSADQVLTGRPVVWLSSAPSVVSIDSAGSSRALSNGSATITASSAGVLGATSVTVGSAVSNPPGAVSDLAAVAVNDTSASLSFTAADDGTGGKASYEVRYAAHPMDWGTAASASSGTCRTPISGASAGTTMHCTVGGLTPATNYDFELVAFRGTLNTQTAVFGALSNVATAATPSAPTPASAVTTVGVAPTPDTLAVGGTVQLTATIKDQNGATMSGLTPAWSSSATGVATVNSSGRVTAVAVGTATITATDSGKSGTAKVVVTATAPPPPTVARVVVTPASVADTIGQRQQFSASVLDSAGKALTGQTVTWSSTAPSVASVNSSGNSTALAAGSASIVATVSGVTGSAQLTVTAPAPAVTTVTVSPSSVTLDLAAIAQLAATVKDQYGNVMSGASVTWSSSTTGIATVSAGGLVVAVGAGSTTIRATSGAKSGTATITVNGPVVNPPPPAIGEPAFSSTTGVMVFSDNMDAYSSITALLTAPSSGTYWSPDPFGVDSRNELLSPGFGGAGHALRQVYSGVNQESHDWDLINPPTTPDTTTHFFQYEGRVTVAGSIANTTLAFKWFMAFHRDGSRVEWNTHDHLPCAKDSPKGNSVWQVYDQAYTVCQANQPVGPYPVDAFNGQWHRFTYQYKPNTSTGSRDGVARMWIDGTKVIDISAAAVGVTPTGGYKTWCNWDDVDALSTQGIVLLRWAGNLTTTTPGFTVDMDDFLWWRAK
jgi:uncharacterized protein YjdB